MSTETVTETSTSVEAASAAEMTGVTALPRVTKPGRVPIKSWALDLEGAVLDQATNLSNLPFAIDHVALMPDAHAGYGMPIGGVLFADQAVVPYAIGVDIGCGVALVETDLTVETLGPDGLKQLDVVETRAAAHVKDAVAGSCAERSSHQLASAQYVARGIEPVQPLDGALIELQLTHLTVPFP